MRLGLTGETRYFRGKPLDFGVLDGEGHGHLPTSMAIPAWYLQGVRQ
jgi:hypothetical protein